MKKNLSKFVLPAVFICVGLLWFLLSENISVGKNNNSTVFELQQVTYDSDIETSGNVETAVTETEDICVTVHVCGCVVNPGVYKLKQGSRIIHAIEAAGGLCEGAVPDYLNHAKIVCDGDKIYFPSTEELLSGSIAELYPEDSFADRRININTATKEELMRLPGIGESKADIIIKYRQENGSFDRIEDIMHINGIKEAVFNGLKDYITV